MSRAPVSVRQILAVSLVLLLGVVIVRLLVAGDSEPERAGAAAPSSAAPADPADPADPASGDARGSDAGADPAPSGPSDPAPSGSASGRPSAGASGSAAPRQQALRRAPYREVTPEPAIPLTRTADFGTGLTLSVTATEAVQGVARGPGEVAGPALRLSMRADSDGSAPIGLDTMTVTVTYGAERTPASSLQQPGGDPFQGELAPGASARAAYVFAVPTDERDRIRVTAGYTGDAPTVVFAGAAG